MRDLNKNGLYIPWLQFSSRFLMRLSLNFWIKRLARYYFREEKTPAWVSEIYQFVFIVFGIAVFSGINAVYARPGLAAFVEWGFLYISLEIFVFVLNWFFIDENDLHGYRRSTLCFFLNIFQIALYAEIISIAGGCKPNTGWWAVCQGMADFFSLSLPVIDTVSSKCQFLSFFKWALSVLLVLVVLTNVIGGVVRNEKKKSTPRARR